MAKKFFGVLSLVICIILCGACFSACGKKAVTVQGTINIEYDRFTRDDISGNMYFSFTGPGYSNFSETDNSITAVFGPEKTKNDDNFVVDIFLDDIYAVDLDVSEKNGKPFNITKRDNDTSDQHFFINIPFAESIDYNFVISKPKPRVNQIELALLNDSQVNSTDPRVRDILDHSQIWVENKETNPTNNKLISGFMPIVREQSNTRQFNLAGKYINADMTQETFTLYLKYDNEGKTLPYSKVTMEYALGLANYRRPIMRVAELDGQKVYAFDYQTEYLGNERTIKMSFDGLEYVSAQVYDNSGSVIVGTFDDVSYSAVDLYFERIGWQSGANGEWQNTNLPRKNYGQPLTIKYKFTDVDAGGHEDLIKQVLDFSKIKFQINGKTVATTFETTNDGTGEILTYTIVIGEYDTPETYADEYAERFEIGVDRNTIKEKDNLEGVKEVVYSSELDFWQGNDNLFLSNFIEGGNTKHARVYTVRGGSGTYDPFGFTVNNIGMFERFTFTITLGEKTYTKEFVLGQDFLQKISGDGQLAGAYLFDIKYAEAESYPILPTDGVDDGLVYYYIYINNDITQLTVRVNYEQAKSMEVKLSNIEYRTIEFEANGDAYAGGINVESDILGEDRTEKVNVDFDLNKMYNPDTSNINIRVAIYSEDVLICYLDISGNQPEFVVGNYIYDNTFYFYASSWSSEPDIVLQFSTNGRISIHEHEDDPFINILITKIVVTFTSAN